MSALETYLRQCVETIGLARQQAIANLRHYIRLSKEEEIILAVSRIVDQELLRHLWSAGLTEPVQSAVRAQLQKITEGRG